MPLESAPFFVKNCSQTAIATGIHANSLIELRDKLLTIDEGCIYHHFWGGRLKPQFIHSQHHNDFASWAFFHLHDQILAEQLSIIDPTEFDTLELVRQELIEKIERRLDEEEQTRWTSREDRFHFIQSTLIIFNSDLILSNPEQLPEMIPQLSPSSIYYHFIDARSRTEKKKDDFTIWLNTFGETYQLLIEKIQAIDPFFLSLTEIKDELLKVINTYFSSRG